LTFCTTYHNRCPDATAATISTYRLPTIFHGAPIFPPLPFSILQQNRSRCAGLQFDVTEVEEAVFSHLIGATAMQHGAVSEIARFDNEDQSGATMEVNLLQAAGGGDSGCGGDMSSDMGSDTTLTVGISDGASVYLSAVLEYLSAEVLELSGNAARENRVSASMPFMK
jgi:hypothetical protein